MENNKENYLGINVVEDGNNITLYKRDFKSLIHIAAQYEKIRKLQSRLNAGEIDGLDFSVGVEEILDGF